MEFNLLDIIFDTTEYVNVYKEVIPVYDYLDYGSELIVTKLKDIIFNYTYEAVITVRNAY